MSLPSQTIRAIRRRSNMHRRRKGGRAPIVIGALAVVAVGLLLSVRLLNPGEGEPVTAPPVPAVKTTTLDPPGPGTTESRPRTPSPMAATREPEPDRAGHSTQEASAQRPLAAPGPGHSRAREQMKAGLELAERNRLVEARQTLSAVLDAGLLGPGDAAFVRDVLTSLNQRLVFSPQIVADDAYARPYVVEPGDRLTAIVKRQGLKVDWRLIKRINRMAGERSLRVGQRLKLVDGPFHVVLDKSDYRLDLYLGSGPDRVYVRSFPVGLGEDDGTPVGRFRVRADSKVINPAWANPRTGEFFARDNPNNPIGERWIGLEGIDESTVHMHAYGIHGTIDPASIGRQVSMGCIRLLPDDVELLYEALTEQTSTVEIRP